MSQAISSTEQRKPAFGISAIVVALAVLAAFHEAPFLDFVDYDDVVISENPALRGGLTSEAVRFAFTQTPTNLWNPLTYLSHALDFQIYGDRAGGHHITNVVFHLAACLLLLAWLRRHTGENGLALAVTLLFAIHPLRVESVIWISERKDVLSAFFYLLTLTFYSLWAKARDKDPQGNRHLYLLAVASAILGLLSKPSLMTLPAALLLVDFWPLRRLDLTNLRSLPFLRERLIEKIPFLVIAIIAATTAWFTWSGNQFLGEPPDHSLAQRIGFASLAYFSYLWKTFFPAGMVAFQPYPVGMETLTLGIAVLLLIVLTALSIWRRTGSPWLLFGWLWFVGLIVPGSGLITITDHFAPDRYTYLAHAGLFTAIAWELVSWGRKQRLSPKIGWALLIVILLPLIFLTHRQSKVWQNAESLWRHAIEVSDENYVAHNQLGLHLLKGGNFDEGIKELKIAMEARPGYPISIGNLSMAYAKNGQLKEAVEWFHKAGPLLPDRDQYRDDLITASLAAGKNDLAADIWKKLTEETPDDPTLQLAAAKFFYDQGSRDEALPFYQRAVELDPDDSEASLSLGAVLIQSGQVDEAIPHLKQSAATAKHKEDEASSRRTLAQAYLLKKEWALALEQYSEAVRLSPTNSLIVNEHAQLLLDVPASSLRNPARALELASTLPVREGGNGTVPNPRFLKTLARALARNGQTTGSEKVAEAGLKVVSMIAAEKPLVEPWTEEELDSLRVSFQRLLKPPAP